MAQLPQGTIVTYALSTGPRRGLGRMALVVYNHNDAENRADLWVFPNPIEDAVPAPFFVSGALRDAVTKKPGTWS